MFVNRTLNPEGHPEIFVCGDLAHFEQNGHQVPGVAQPAMQMGDHVARMIAADLNHQPRQPFHYFDKGDMATIGRLAAVAKVEWPFKAHWSGFPAWIAWLVVHIYFLIGFRNRLAVLSQWVWSYFTFTYGVRLIYGSQASARMDRQGRRRNVSRHKVRRPQSTRCARAATIKTCCGRLDGVIRQPCRLRGDSAVHIPSFAAEVVRAPHTGMRDEFGLGS